MPLASLAGRPSAIVTSGEQAPSHRWHRPSPRISGSRLRTPGCAGDATEPRPAPQYPSFRSTSPIDSSMMSMHFAATSRSITIGGLILNMCPAGIQASPFRNAVW
jgi:hypothetical protein